MAGDARVRYTRAVLKKALLELLKTKPIAKVTVKELCQAADLNRGTFYLHYQEPGDVLREIEEDFFREEMSFMDQYLKDDNPDQLALLFEAVIANREVSLVLFGRNGEPQFTERIQEHVREGILSEWQREFPSYHPSHLRFVYDFVFPGAMNLVLRWLREGETIPLSEFAHRLDCLGHYCHLAIREFHPEESIRGFHPEES